MIRSPTFLGGLPYSLRQLWLRTLAFFYGAKEWPCPHRTFAATAVMRRFNVHCRLLPCAGQEEGGRVSVLSRHGARVLKPDTCGSFSAPTRMSLVSGLLLILGQEFFGRNHIAFLVFKGLQ